MKKPREKRRRRKEGRKEGRKAGKKEGRQEGRKKEGRKRKNFATIKDRRKLSIILPVINHSRSIFICSKKRKRECHGPTAAPSLRETFV